ncbi:MAG: hypothetical protein RR842_11775, partial [Gordonibacter sp.]|uniref:hypothetical protein n=1 Tax=Gordonibacter sp. TaxID=1968902 RepID=UPI002FCA43CE
MGGRGSVSYSGNNLSETMAQIDETIKNWSTYSGVIRSGSMGNGAKENIEKATLFDEYLAGQSYSGRIYRGVTVDDATLKTLLVDKTIDQLGISSWSKSKQVALGFASESAEEFLNGRKVIFVMRDGTKSGADISSKATYKSEQEVVELQCQPNTSMLQDVLAV